MTAAAELGVDLHRFALVPDPGAELVAVVSALIDGFDLVVLGRRAAPAVDEGTHGGRVGGGDSVEGRLPHSGDRLVFGWVKPRMAPGR